MNKYLGVKLIEAEPCTRGEYNKRRGWTIPENENPDDAGFYLVYPDGYISWSPEKQFNDAYRPTSGLNFGLAIEAMKKGYKVCRTGWNGKNMFIYMTVGNTVSKDFIPKFASLPDSVKVFLSEKNEDVIFNSSITMYTAKGEMQPGWLASQADMLADDWMILE